ncbi:MAG: plasmid mobilization protein [Acidithiobacillus sp.]
MKRNVVFRLEEAEITNLQANAREAGMSVSDYIRAAITRRPAQNRAADTRMEARLARMEQMLASTLMSAWEVQVLTRGTLADERFARVKKIGVEHAALWRIDGLDLDNMLPKITKENTNE